MAMLLNGVEKRHESWTRQRKAVKRNRDVTSGPEAVRQGRETYLPRLSGHSRTAQGNALYEAFWRQGWCPPFAGRTLENLVALATSHEAQILPADDEWVRTRAARITGALRRVTCQDLIKRGVSEVMTTGVYGYFVDYGVPTRPAAVAAEGAADPGRRFFIRPYIFESIINWGEWEIGGWSYPWIVLLENVKVFDPAEPFSNRSEPLYLVLAIDPETGFYYQQQCRSIPGSKTLQPIVRLDGANATDEHGRFFPLRDNVPLSEIPFFWAGVKDNDSELDPPPITGLCEVALQMYFRRTSRNNALSTSENPTFITKGNIKSKTGKSGELEMGAGAVIQFDENGDAKFVGLENTLAASDTELDRLFREAVAEGARLLEVEKRAVESAETHKGRKEGQVSTVGAVLANVCRALSDAFTFGAWWEGRADGFKVEVKPDSSMGELSMSPEDAEKWAQLWILGAITYEELRVKLAQGGAVAPGAAGSLTDDAVWKEYLQERIRAVPILDRLKLVAELTGLGIKRNQVVEILGLESLIPKDEAGEAVLLRTGFESMDVVLTGGAGAAAQGLDGGLPRPGPAPQQAAPVAGQEPPAKPATPAQAE